MIKSNELVWGTLEMPREPDSTYTMAILGTPGEPTNTAIPEATVVVLAKRVGPTGNESFVVREINPLDDTFRYVANGETLQQAIHNANNSPRGIMSSPVARTANDYVVSASLAIINS